MTEKYRVVERKYRSGTVEYFVQVKMHPDRWYDKEEFRSSSLEKAIVYRDKLRGDEIESEVVIDD